VTELAFPHADTTAVSRRDRRVGALFVLLAATLFAVNGSVSKLALEASGMGTLRWTELRSTGATLGLGAWLIWRRPGTLRVTRQGLGALVAYGIFGFAFVQWLYYVAIARLPIGIGLLFEFTGILLVALWARFVWREPVRARIWPALGLVLLGLGLVAQVWAGATLDGLGVAAGLAAACSLALFYLQGEHLVGGRPPLSVVCLGLLVASVFWAVVQPWWSFPFDTLTTRVELPGTLLGVAPVWLMALYTIALGTIAPFALSVTALSKLPATTVGILATFEPAAAAVIAWAWLGESLATVQVVGGLVVVTGIVLAITAR
jgi:drug/metabolite transporter (DMT)-like permease